jgi:hypothetical protein
VFDEKTGHEKSRDTVPLMAKLFSYALPLKQP